MIYVLAAYSITIATLALYGVVLQHRRRVYAQATEGAASAEEAKASAGSRSGGFNLGAALLPPFWMWQHGMRGPGAALLLFCLAIVPLYRSAMWIPLLFVAMVPMAAGLALGFVGNRIARNHRPAESVVAFSSSQLPWAIVGITLFTIVIPWGWYFLGSAP